MSNTEKEIAAARARLITLKAEGRSALACLVVAGYDFTGPNLFDRVRADIRFLRERIQAIRKDFGRLLNQAKEYGVTVEPTEISPPDHGVTPTLGTTTGDIPSLPERPETPDEANLIDQLTDRLFNPGGPGTGTKIGTGEAAGNVLPPPPDKSTDKPNDKSSGDPTVTDGERQMQKERDELKTRVDSFQRQFDLLQEIYALRLQARAISRAFSKLWDKNEKLKVPNPEVTDGTYNPKHPLEDPWAELLARPKNVNPLGDPTKDDGTSGPSNIKITHGEHTDPVPGDDKDPPGAKKIIKNTHDAVIDPTPGLTAKPGLFARILNIFR